MVDKYVYLSHQRQIFNNYEMYISAGMDEILDDINSLIFDMIVHIG